MSKKKNPIAEKSKEKIRTAFLSLLSVKRYEEITISEIAQESGVSRRTFYRNFMSKNEVVRSCCECIFKEYLAYLDRDIDYSVNHMIEVFFCFWKNHTDFLNLLSDNQLLGYLVEASNQYWAEIYNRFCLYWGEKKKDSELEYFLLYHMGGLWNILTKWLYSEKREEPKELEKMLQCFSINMFLY